MVNSEKGKNKNSKKDWYFSVMLAQTIVGVVLIALMVFSVRSDGVIAKIMSEGYRKYMSDDFTGEDFSEAFIKINEYADAFAEKPDTEKKDDAVAAFSQTESSSESETESEISAGGKDLEFTSLDALEGICFDPIDTGFSMTEPLNDYSISSTFGYRIGPISGDPGIHTGLDMAAAYGTAITAAADGIVADAAWDNSYGNYVKILHDNNTVTIYAHCSSLCVQAGEKVLAGDTIAKVGSTGDSTGNHLHFEVRKDNIRINPEYMLFD